MVEVPTVSLPTGMEQRRIQAGEYKVKPHYQITGGCQNGKYLLNHIRKSRMWFNNFQKKGVSVLDGRLCVIRKIHEPYYHRDFLLDKQLILCNILIYNMVYLRNLAKGTNWEQRI